jgi:hypothetical protein
MHIKDKVVFTLNIDDVQTKILKISTVIKISSSLFIKHIPTEMRKCYLLLQNVPWLLGLFFRSEKRALDVSCLTTSFISFLVSCSKSA